jgi:hypothetical protein
MKKVFKFISVVMFSSLLMSASVFAKSGNDSKKAEYIRQQLADVLSDASNDGNTGFVSIYFNVTSDKSFELLNVEGQNINLVKEVENTLKSNKIDVSTISEGKYLVKIHFVDKYASVSPYMPAQEVLRDKISDVLSSVSTDNGGSIDVSFIVKNGNFIVKKVEGENRNLTSEVERILTSNSIAVPSELAGYYQLRVRF